MENNKRNSNDIYGFMESLEAKKSERTTLKLTEKAVEGISYLKQFHHVTVKELFDFMYKSKDCQDGFDIEKTAKGLKEHPSQLCDMPRKTYVLSKGAIRVFSALSKKHEVSRDDLISFMIEDWADRNREYVEESKEKYREGYKLLSEYEVYTKDVALKFSKIIGGHMYLRGPFNKGFVPDIDVLRDSTSSQIEKLKAKLQKLINDCDDGGIDLSLFLEDCDDGGIDSRGLLDD